MNLRYSCMYISYIAKWKFKAGQAWNKFFLYILLPTETIILFMRNTLDTKY